MPDDTHPRGSGGDLHGDDDATQAVPVPGAGPEGDAPGTGPGDLTQALPPTGPATPDAGEAGRSGGEPTQAIAPPGEALTQAMDAGAGAAAAEGGAQHRAHSSQRPPANRAWIVTIVAVAVALAGAGLALGLSGGGSPAGSTTTTSQGGGAAVPATSVATGPPCPLTGAPAPGGGRVPARPALAVKVDDYPQARPQSGLNQADIVFDEPVEGGITRFVAVFQCQSPSLIGPIRSARAVDLQILDQLSDPLFIHAGGINPVLALIRQGNLIDDNVFAHPSIIQTPPGRYPPYDTYISAAAGWSLNPKDTTPPTPLFHYSTTPPAGTPVASVHIPFASTNNALWTWNKSARRWLLSYSGTPATTVNGGQISAVNIVIQTVQVTYGPWAENDVGGLEVQSKMTGSGPLTVLRNGIAVSGTWSRASLSDPTTLTATDGSSIALQPGRTWVEIVPSAVHVTTTSTSR